MTIRLRNGANSARRSRKHGDGTRMATARNRAINAVRQNAKRFGLRSAGRMPGTLGGVDLLARNHRQEERAGISDRATTQHTIEQFLRRCADEERQILSDRCTATA